MPDSGAIKLWSKENREYRKQLLELQSCVNNLIQAENNLLSDLRSYRFPEEERQNRLDENYGKIYTHHCELNEIIDQIKRKKLQFCYSNDLDDYIEFRTGREKGLFEDE